MSEEKQYAERDLMGMDVAGNHYCRHISAMTREQLHSKSDIAAELGWRDLQIAELKEQRDALAAENAALVAEVVNIREQAEDVYAAGYRQGHLNTADGIAYSPGVEDEFYHNALQVMAEVETPSTDAYLNAVRAEAIPEGYVLVPQQMHLSADAMESLCFHCGDGGFAFGEFTEGLLWVGDIENDDGTKTYGLNVATADYPDEGSANISEFAAQLRAGNAGKDGSHD